MCAPMAIAMVAMMAVAAITSGIQASQAGAAQQAQAKANAKYEAGAYQVRQADRDRQQAQTIARAQALYGADGLDSILGSPRDVALGTAAQYGQQGYEDKLSSQNTISAMNTAGANAAQSGKNAFTSAILGAGQQAATDYSRFYASANPTGGATATGAATTGAAATSTAGMATAIQ